PYSTPFHDALPIFGQRDEDRGLANRTNNRQKVEFRARRARSAVVPTIGRDGFALLEAVRGPDTPVWLRELPSVQILRTAWVQQYYRTRTENGTEATRRASKDLPPGRVRLASPYNLDARYGVNRESG